MQGMGLPSAVAAFRLLLLTGCRMSEIRDLRWEYVKDDCIELPDAKTGGRVGMLFLAYNLANFMRTLALPKEVEHWSLTTLPEKLVKIGAKVVRHGRYVTFQLAEVAVPSSRKSCA